MSLSEMEQILALKLNPFESCFFSYFSFCFVRVSYSLIEKLFQIPSFRD